MSQTFTDDCYSAGMQASLSLQAFEDNMLALKSWFSGTGAPSNTVPGMAWFDTNTNKIPKLRNRANNAWLGIMVADASHQIWVYRNSAPDGWVVSSSAADRVLALAGGSTYTPGGNTAGTWTQPDCTLTKAQIPALTYTVSMNVSGSGSNASVLRIYGYSESGGGVAMYSNPIGVQTLASVSAAPGITVTGDATGPGAHNHGSTYRPAAAVGTMQYMDI